MIYPKYLESLIQAIISGTPKIAVLKPSYVYNAAHDFFNDVSAHEVIATGYVAGGKALVNPSFTVTNNVITLRADNPIWLNFGTADIAHLVIYTDTGNPATSRLIKLHSLPTTRAVVNGNLTIEFDAQGILSLQ